MYISHGAALVEGAVYHQEDVVVGVCMWDEPMKPDRLRSDSCLLRLLAVLATVRAAADSFSMSVHGTVSVKIRLATGLLAYTRASRSPRQRDGKTCSQAVATSPSGWAVPLGAERLQ
jgi:hypothetical protein